MRQKKIFFWFPSRAMFGKSSHRYKLNIYQVHFCKTNKKVNNEKSFLGFLTRNEKNIWLNHMHEQIAIFQELNRTLMAYKVPFKRRSSQDFEKLQSKKENVNG